MHTKKRTRAFTTAALAMVLGLGASTLGATSAQALGTGGGSCGAGHGSYVAVSNAHFVGTENAYMSNCGTLGVRAKFSYNGSPATWGSWSYKTSSVTQSWLGYYVVLNGQHVTSYTGVITT